MNFFSDIQTNKSKQKGLITVFLFCSVLMVLFSFTILEEPDPPKEEPPLEIEEYIEMDAALLNYGDSESGGGEVEPENSGDPEPQPDQPVADATPTDPEDVITTPDPEVPSLPTKEDPVEKKGPEQTVDNRITKAGNLFNNNNNDSQSEGPDNNPFNKGKLNGDPDGNSYVGGDGLDGKYNSTFKRKLLFVPKITDNSQKEGKVVVEMVVDRNGKVLSARAGLPATTLQDKKIWEMLEREMKKTKFSANPNAPATVRGTLTFNFINK